MTFSNRPLQPPAHSSSINLLIIIIVIILDDSDHHTRSRGIAREKDRFVKSWVTHVMCDIYFLDVMVYHK